MKKKSIRENKVEKESEAEVNYGSIYAQLGYKNSEEMETKSTLVVEIAKAIKKKKLTQTQAAKILGISQPKLSELLNGRFRGYSVERLMHFLNELGQDIDIIVKSKPRNRRARINVYPSTSVHRKTGSNCRLNGF